MAQQYDKIFKENFEENIQNFARKMLGVDPNTLVEIPDDSQYTIEKRPDFLKKVVNKGKKADHILHIEAQTTDPKTMVRRMLLYYGFLYNDYGLEVKQFVLFIGKKKEPTMPHIIQHKNLNFQFEVINVRKIDHRDFLYSDKPEDVVFAILCNFLDKDSETIIDQILARLKQLGKDELNLRKYLTQLEVLSKLRNLQEVTIQKIAAMPITYDLKTDLRYLQGEQIGQKKGKQIGRKEGKQIGRKEERAFQLKKSIKIFMKQLPDFSHKQLAELLEISLREFKQLLAQIQTENNPKS